jgi:AhpD family alkylhydroperoxidase
VSESRRRIELAALQDDPRGINPTFDEIRRTRGDVSNLFRLIAVCPPALEPFFALSKFVRDDSELPPRLREIAILVTATTFDVRYEIAAHTIAGRQAGLTDDEIQALKAANWTGFSVIEQAVIRYASEVAHRRDAADETIAALLIHFSERQVVELAVIVAWYHLVAAIVQPLRLELDPELDAESTRSRGAQARG